MTTLRAVCAAVTPSHVAAAVVSVSFLVVGLVGVFA